MAIYHFSAKVISRASGSSALAAAAYRSASRLHDQRLDRHHDFSNKAGVIHSEVMLPQGAPDHLSDRERLWNEVEAAEKRIDAQLAREVEFAIPRELCPEMGIALARDFVSQEYVGLGMIADLNVHRDIGADGEPKPHAHVMLTMRKAGQDGFGKKVRDWNRTQLLEQWRERWASHVNQRLAELDIDARIDHRSLEAQGIDLEPQHKIGPAATRMAAQGLALERVDEHREIARSNGDKLLAHPALALGAITHGQATFTTRDLAMFVHRHSDGKEQFDRVMAAVRGSPELVALGRDGRGQERFTSRTMIDTEQRLERCTTNLAERRHYGVARRDRDLALARAAARGMTLSPEQGGAFEHVTEAKGLSVVIGYAGTGKSAMLGIAREAWESSGYQVRGLALSGIAAENLEGGSGIASRTITSLEHQWAQGRERLSVNDVLVIDEAGMIGSRQMERVISEAEKRGAKIVLVGDPEQLQAIEAGAAFRSIAERHGGVEVTDIRRQREEWQRLATRQLAAGRTREAIRQYEASGMVHAAATREGARMELIDRWDRDRIAEPGASRIILTHTRAEVKLLNEAARERMRETGELGEDVKVHTERGTRMFAHSDRVMFLRNERSLGVKNGSLGRVDAVHATRMAVTLDDGRSLSFDFKHYAHVDHGFAATIHKAQGVTVDRTHVLATPGLDRHAAYVALSRHRDSVQLHYGEDDFADRGQLVRTLSRERAKDMASDYVRGFSERREIRLPRSRPHVPEKPPERAPRQRDMFKALGLTSNPTPVWHQSRALAPAVTRHARIVSAILFARSIGDPASVEQRAELRLSRAALDAITPNGANDLEAAFAADRPLIAEARDGRTTDAIRAMRLAADMRVDPKLRADVFVQRWQTLERQRRLLLRDHEDSRAGRIADAMTGMAKGLERDAQVESLLRARKRELGLPAVPERTTGQSLMEMIGRGRSRGLDIGM